MNTTDQPKTMAERLRDAAVSQAQERAAERRSVEEVVLGTFTARRRIGEIVRIGDDYVVQVENGKDVTWTTLVGGKTSHEHFYQLEHALLHLLSRRHGGDGTDAAFFAARVLGMPTDA